MVPTLDKPLVPATIPNLSSVTSPSLTYFVFNVTICLENEERNVLALIDTGATGCFMDESFFASLNLTPVSKIRPYNVELVDGSNASSGPVQLETPPVRARISGFDDYVTSGLISSPRFPLILGLPWLQRANPQIDWKTSSMLCSSSPKVSTSDDSVPCLSVMFCPMLCSVSVMSTTTSVSIPLEYSSYADVFEEKNADILPEHRPYDIGIDLKPGATVPWGPIYNLSEPELAELRKYLDENLAKGFIRPSKSSGGAPILFVKKKNGSLRLCVDYRGLNNVTIKNRYPLPLISEIIRCVKGKKFFTRIDLKGAYNLVRVKSGDEWKTAFRCRYGHFEYLVMPFGLTNAPATFQHLMNDIFRDLLDIIVLVYLDDILIFSDTYEQHVLDVIEVLSRLRNNNLYASLSKCEFHQSEVLFLGFVLSGTGIRMDSDKLDTILAWKSPTSVKDIQIFLGFANFYRVFINNFAKLASPLTRLLRKDVPFIWSDTCENSFSALKNSFVSAPILHFPDTTRPFILETDYALCGVLSQYEENGNLVPVGYYSRKLLPAEINYEIHDKELLAIIACFENWRYWLIGSTHPITVYTDHKNLLYFSTTKRLNRRQARWSLFLTDFDFNIVYREGKLNGKPDALSRRPEYAPKEGDPLRLQQFQTLLKPENFIMSTSVIGTLVSLQTPELVLSACYDLVHEENPSEDDTLLSRIRSAQKEDPYVQKLLETNLEPHMAFIDDILLVFDRIYVPDSIRLEVLRLCHDSLLAGHFGIEKTMNLVMRSYWWPTFRKDVKLYVSSCQMCGRTKTITQLPAGLLKPLPIPKRPWASLSVDFIVGLPLVSGYDSVCVFVCRLTKMAHFIPTTTTITAMGLAELFVRDIFRLHGLPFDIVSDRGPQFVSNFWRELLKLLNIQQKLSTAFHPQTDGQTEITNKTLEQYLRCYLDYQQENWLQLLPIAEFVYNNSQHASLKNSPFYINYGFNPAIELSTHVSTNTTSTDFATNFDELLETARNEMRLAQQQQKRFADKHRRPHDIQVGKMVWLNRRNLKSTRPNQKLDYRRFGPFEVTEQVNENAFRIKLPPLLNKIHDVFHVSLLELVKENTFQGRIEPPPPPLIIDDSTEYEVEEILDVKQLRNKLRFLVRWKGYGPEDNTWEPQENLTNAQDLVKQFYEKNPTKLQLAHPRLRPSSDTTPSA